MVMVCVRVCVYIYRVMVVVNLRRLLPQLVPQHTVHLFSKWCAEGFKKMGGCP